MIFARLRIKESGSGYVHFNDILQDEYFRQLTAEKAVTRFHRGFKKRVFEKVRPRNEALDCMVYSIAAYSILGVNVNALADKMTGQEQPQKQESEPERKQEAFVPHYPRKGNFANSWR